MPPAGGRGVRGREGEGDAGGRHSLLCFFCRVVGGVQGESVGAAATSSLITGGGHGRSVLEPAWDPPEGVCVCALCAPEAACLCLPVRRVFVDLAREPPRVGVACRGVQVGLGSLPTDVSLMAATWATVTFVLSLSSW